MPSTFLTAEDISLMDVFSSQKSMLKQVLATELNIKERSGVNQLTLLLLEFAECCQQEEEGEHLLQHGPI